LTLANTLPPFLKTHWILQIEELEDIKGVIRIRTSKDRKHNGQKKKDKRTNNDLQNITQKTKDRATRNTTKIRGLEG
jgi:hypothetical protein